MRGILILAAVLTAVLVVLAGPARAAEVVGQLTGVSGQASLIAADGAATPAAALARVREGDTLRLGPGARVDLVFFANDREETWQGPGAFVAGREGGRGLDGLAPAAVAAEPKPGAGPAKDLPAESLGKGGQLIIRGKKAAPDKPTP